MHRTLNIMNRRWVRTCSTGVPLLITALAIDPSSDYRDHRISPQQEEELVVLARDASSGVPTFLFGNVLAESLGVASVEQPALIVDAIFAKQAGLVAAIISEAVPDPEDLQLTAVLRDRAELVHVVFQQTHQGLEVDGASLRFHFNPSQTRLLALTTTLRPGVDIDTDPELRPAAAIALLRDFAPHLVASSEPRLTIYTSARAGGEYHLAWVVEMSNDSTITHMQYYVDAVDGSLLDSATLVSEAKERKVFDGAYRGQMQGTPVRQEGDPPTGDSDTDHAYKYSGVAYDHFRSRHGLDSYNDLGAPIESVVHSGRGLNNAYWFKGHLVYGDGMPVLDVVAHEYAHAVLDNMGPELARHWQTGAIREALADFFAMSIDRGDRLFGEDLPSGPLRNVEDPPQLGLGHPRHVNDWVQTCLDSQGVHSNNGILNRALMYLVDKVGWDTAELLVFHAATGQFLHKYATLEEFRAAMITVTILRHGDPSPELSAVHNGFNQVGLDGRWQPQQNKC